jgi:hypothetical protein
MKRCKGVTKTFAVFLLTTCCLVNEAAANLIQDNGTFTTINDLDWPIIENMTQTSAIDSNPGWREATGQEATEMLNTMFETTLVYDSSNSLEGISHLANGAYLVDRFRQMFGIIEFNGDLFSYAHLDDYGTIGVRPSPSSDLPNVNIFNGSNAASTGDPDYSRLRVGVALVRQAVPEPSTLVIFALSLLGLWIGRSRVSRV